MDSTPHQPAEQPPTGGSARLIQIVMFALEDVFHVTARDLLSPRRTAHLAWPRMVGMFALMDQFGYTSAAAAAAFRRAGHASALHARRTVARRTTRSLYDRTKTREFLTRLSTLRQP